MSSMTGRPLDAKGDTEEDEREEDNDDEEGIAGE